MAGLWASYARVSYADTPDCPSVDVQQELNLTEIERRGGVCPPEQRYTDKKSAETLNRKGFQRLLDMVRTGDLDGFVVWRWDRISRDVEDGRYVDKLARAIGCEIVSLTQTFDTTTPDGKAFFTVSLAFSQQERELTSLRVKKAMKALVRKGRMAGRPKAYGWQRLEKCNWVRDEVTQPVLERIFRLYADDQIGTTLICRQLNREGIPAPRGGMWDPTTLLWILKNPIYQGIQNFGQWTGDWPFERVVPEDLAARAYARVKAQSFKRGPATVRHEWQNLCYCGVCGEYMRRSAPGGKRSRKRYEYVRCSSKHDALHDTGVTACTAPSLPVEAMAAATRAFLDLCAMCQPVPRNPDPSPSDVEARIRSVEERKRRAVVAWRDFGADEAETREIVASCDRETAELRRPHTQPHPAMLATFHTAWGGMDVGERNRALKLLSSRLVVYPGEMRIVLRALDWEGWPRAVAVSTLNGAVTLIA